MAQVQAERRLVGTRLALLEAEIAAGKLKVFNWAVAHVGKILVRINGHHTAHIFSRRPEIPENAIAAIEHYECDSMEEAAELWRRFDSQKSVRTDKELLANFAKTIPALSHIQIRCLQVTRSALVIEKYGVGYANKISSEAKNAVLNEGTDFAIFFHQIPALTRLNSANLLHRTGAAVAALITFRAHREACGLFWNEVATSLDVWGAAVHPHSGTAKLRETLIGSDGATGKGARTARPKVEWETTAKYAIQAWNAWMSGRPLQRLVVTKEIPKAIDTVACQRVADMLAGKEKFGE